MLEQTFSRDSARVTVVLVGLTLLLVAGCTSTDTGVALPTSSATAPSTSPTPTPPVALPPAADGADLTACADGSCEIRVDGPATIPIGLTFQVAAVSVESIGDDELTVGAEFAGGNIASSRTGRCSVSTMFESAGSPAMSRIKAGAGARLVANRVGIEVVAIARGAAVLRLAPA